MDENMWKDHYKYEYPKFWVNRIKEYGFSRYHQIILDLLDPKKGESVLECGIGTGEPFALRLAKEGLDMWGIDISQSLLDECKKNTAEWNVDINGVLGDLCKYSDLFSYGLQDSALLYFGAKLVYICKKEV